MTFLIAAAGTGGHVYPGLSVGEALVDLGISRNRIVFAGGERLEARVYPEEGFPFVQVELRGLRRSLTVDNVTLPGVVLKARKRIGAAIRQLDIKVVLGMGGYVTIPAALAARKAAIPFFNAEQNAEAGLANKVSARWAVRSFVAFPETGGMEGADWVGNPVREPFWDFSREALRPDALAKYRLDADVPVLGVFGGSLGAKALNDAVAEVAGRGLGDSALQILHLTGETHEREMLEIAAAANVKWVRLGFEESMESFYAACDLVLARAGGAVAEITATSTPAILVPGDFGSSGHQAGNAGFIERAGAAVTITEDSLTELPEVLRSLLFDSERLNDMRLAATRIAKPRAAHDIARHLMEAA